MNRLKKFDQCVKNFSYGSSRSDLQAFEISAHQILDSTLPLPADISRDMKFLSGQNCTTYGSAANVVPQLAFVWRIQEYSESGSPLDLRDLLLSAEKVVACEESLPQDAAKKLKKLTGSTHRTYATAVQGLLGASFDATGNYWACFLLGRRFGTAPSVNLRHENGSNSIWKEFLKSVFRRP